jgi:hypothetical protein
VSAHVSYGDNVRILRTAETERLGIADMIGNVYGETTPSETKVKVIGKLETDYAVNVYFDTLDVSYWFAQQILEFVGHAPGTEIHVHGTPFKSVRQPDGTWKDIPVKPDHYSPRHRTAYRAAMGVALAASLMLVWLSLGVGIIGEDGDPANVMYFGVLAIGIVGAIIARIQPRGMARALVAMALTQALVTVIALGAGLGLPWSGPAETLLLNGFFIALFVGSAWLFWRSAPGRPEQAGNT